MTSRKRKVLLRVGIALAITLVALAIVAIRIVQSEWFASYAMRTIVTAAEKGTGGRVEVGSFHFDWRRLQVEIKDLVIHGAEPAGAAPFLRVPTARLNLRLFTGIHHILDVTYLGIDGLEANIIVLADGQSNVPHPAPSAGSVGPPLRSIVNAAIGHLDLNDATIVFADAKETLSLHADNFRAQLWFNILPQGYRGELSFQPVYVASRGRAPVRFTVTLPVSIESDRVSFQGASIATPQSTIHIDGSVENLRSPRISAHVSGQIALADLKNAGGLDIDTEAMQFPPVAVLDAQASVAPDSIQVTALRLSLGQSGIEASGQLMDPHGSGSLRVEARLALDEVGRLIDPTLAPEGSLTLSGTAKLDAASQYIVDGNLTGSRISVRQGSRRTADMDIASAVHVDPHNVALSKLRVNALGAVLTGDASLQDFARYEFHGGIRDLALRSAAAVAGERQLPYAGIVSGLIHAAGDLKDPRSLTAQIRLLIGAGKIGIPVSGRLFADYDAKADDLKVQDSYIVLPHSRLNVAGSAGRQLNVSLTTTDLDDILAAASLNGPALVDLHGHAAEFNGSITGGLTSGRVSGHLRAAAFTVEGRAFDSLTLDATASRSGLAIQNAECTRGMMRTHFAAQVGMDNWKIRPNQAVGVHGEIASGDVADLFALVGRPATDSSGALTATVDIGGTVGNPSGSVSASATNGMLRGEPFDRLQAQVSLRDQSINVSSATVDRAGSHLALSADLRHPTDSFTTGRLHAHVQSNPIHLADTRTLQKLRPGTAGTFEIDADATADIGVGDFQIVSLSGTAAAGGLRLEGQSYGDLNVTAHSSATAVEYQVVSTFAGSNIRATGSTSLQRDHGTVLDANIANLPIERVLAAAQRTDVPAKGTLSGSVHFSGTRNDPTGSVDLNLANAILYDEPVSRLRAKASYETRRAVIQQLDIEAAGSQLGLTAEFTHPQDRLDSGTIQFHVNGNGVDLARVRNVQIRRPGLAGTLRLAADGTAELHSVGPRISLQDLKANVGLTGVSALGKSLGDATLTAETQNNKINVDLTSNLTGGSIKGRVSAQPAGDYPVDAQVSFENIEWARLQEVIGHQTGDGSSFNAATDGQITVQGPVMKPEQLRGNIRLNRLELSSVARSKAGLVAKQRGAEMALKNQDPISATLENEMVRIDSAHLTGPQSDFQAKGTFGFKNRALDLTLNGNANLAVLQTMDPDISSSGSLKLATTIRGTVAQPAVNGTIQLENASFNDTQFPNGLSNANGTVEFNGNTASLKNLTAQTGGGKVTLTGFLLLTDQRRFGIRLNAAGVRTDVQQGVSIVLDGNLNLTGTADASTLSGRATVTRVNYAPRTDLGSILTRSAPSIPGSSSSSPLLDNMKLDVQVQTSDALSVQSALTQSLEGNANLQVRGTASRPSVLGRVNLTGGSLNFFGSQYTVNSGSVAFYNRVRVEPVLDINLETNAEGVDVTLRVTGPIDNMKLSYTSDPPLQFDEIIGLLATGKTPTTDPTVLANNPAPQQSFSEMGESALLGNALANPVANRLQRVFGVTQLKINPAFTNGSSTPDAQLSLQQQIAGNITFTYVTAVDNANAETIRVEVTLNPRWSAAAMRDENGIFSINLLYNKHFR